MPRASVWLIRIALLYLVVGAGIGALMLAGKGNAALAWALVLRPAHQDLLVAGWLLQLVFGVAFWILPRLPEQDRGEGTPRLVVAAVLLNAGAIAAAGGALAGSPWMLGGGRAAQLGAALVFVSLAWRRIRRYGLGAEAVGVSGPGGR
jgi:hypothetical protein